MQSVRSEWKRGRDASQPYRRDIVECEGTSVEHRKVLSNSYDSRY